MNSNPKIDLLRDVVTAAQQEIDLAFVEFEANPSDDTQVRKFVDSCITHVDNIATAASMTESPGIEEICNHLILRTQKTRPGTKSAVLKFSKKLTAWMVHLQAFFNDPVNADLHKQLISIIPKKNQGELKQKLLGEAETDDHDSNIEDVSDEISLEPDEIDERVLCVNTTDNNNEIFGMLAAELIEIRPQLSSALGHIIQDQDTSANSAKYIEIVTRVKDVCASIGTTGLESICEFINKNIALLSQIDTAERIAAADSFETWPDFLLSYLANPIDTEVCLNLLAHLQVATWPEPYTEETVHELLEALADIPASSVFGEDVDQRQIEATADDVAVTCDDDVNPALLDAFFQEAPTTAAQFSECMDAIGDDADITQIAEAAQRLTHTLKGSANLVGAKGIANLSHHLEDILEYLAKNQLRPPNSLLDTMKESADCIESMIDSLRGLDDTPADAQQILQDVLNWANKIDSGNINTATDPNPIETESGPSTLDPDIAETPYLKDVEQPVNRRRGDRRSAADEILHVPTTAVDKMFRIAGEVSIAIGQVQEHLKRLTVQGRNLREQDNLVQRRRFELENIVGVRSFAGIQRNLQKVSGSEDIFDSLELDQYDEFYTSAHSFIEAVTDSRELALSFQSEITSLDGLFRQHKIMNDELQQMIMTTRMVPVDTISGRLQRSVRQACRATGKQARLQIDGAELLMDSEILSRLVDPLTHVLRNSVDHGIETEDVRRSANKRDEGSLQIRFYQAGNDMIVECTDDGRGLDRNRIRDTAIEGGYATANRELSDRELTNILSQSGFTTRDSVTQISGRGVGLDVVQNTVAALKGTMEVGSSDSGGFMVLIRLPLTLISTHALLILVGDKRYAIPTNSLEQILAPDSGSINRLGNEVTFEQDNDVYPVRLLGDLLGMTEGAAPADGSGKPVLITRSGTESVALIIDQVINSHDVVVKSLGSYVKDIEGVAGVSILGDGSVVPVIDLPRLLAKTALAQIPASNSAATKRTTLRPNAELFSVLIVDDSLSVRTSLSELVSDAGFQPLLARDGLEAIEILRKQAPIVVLADLEMPNMNGLELTSHIRADEKLRHLPILMITSRTQKKHRDEATAAGVTEYVTKPYNEDDLSDLVVSYTRQDKAYG